MNNLEELKIRIIKDTEKPMLIDPKNVGCGFLLFPIEMSKLIIENHVHQALQTNKQKMWEAVLQFNPNIPVHTFIAYTDIEPRSAIDALNQIGKYPNYSIAIDSMKMSPDGGRKFVQVYVGFNWKSGQQEVFVAGPEMIIPGKQVPNNITKSSNIDKVYSQKPWWKIW